MKKIGIISVRDRHYHPNRRLMEAAAARGIQALLLNPYRVRPLVVNGGLIFSGHPDPFELDAVIPRQGADIGNSSMALIQAIGLSGIRLVNDLNAISLAKDKMSTLQLLASVGVPVPDTILVNSRDGFFAVLARMGGYPVVYKATSGRQGDGVRLIENKHQALDLLDREWDRRTGFILQRFYPVDQRRDVRVLVIGRQIAGSVVLKPQANDFRANFHLSRNVRPATGFDNVKDIAIRAAAALGLSIAGVDILVDRIKGPMVIEVNYAPGFQGMEAATGMDIAGRIIDYLFERTEGEMA